ncbi:hypothetical protein [Pseudomonas sp. NPDC088444]|uniref:hypothetical protein n=1 Tax=Pseudomonas sp. NPDC088444 TaxID=3364456 RepID=UPI00384E8622
MDAANFTLTHDISCAPSPDVRSSNGFHLEKISCSDPSKSPFLASDLVGKRVCFDQFCPAVDEEPAYTYRFVGLVLGFSLGVSVFKHSDSLYLWPEGFSYQEFFDISSLSVVSVLS